MNLLDLMVKISVDDQASAKVGSTSDGIRDKMSKTASGVSAFGVAFGNVMSNVVTAGWNKFMSGIDGGIKRVDVLNQFNSTMVQLGESTEAAGASVEAIKKGLDGLPSKTQDIASFVGQIKATGISLDESTKLGLAFNDAMLSGGKGTEGAQRASEAYSKALAKGKFEMENWFAMVETAPAQLNQLAESILGAGHSYQDLYDAMKDGSVTMEQFNSALIANGDAFHEQAKASTKGIGTSLENFQSRINNAWANIITAINPSKIANLLDKVSSKFGSVGTEIGKALGPVVSDLLDKADTIVPKVMKAVTKGVSIAASAGQAIGAVIGFVVDHIGLIAPAVGVAVAAFEGFKLASFVASLNPVVAGLTAIATVAGVVATVIYDANRRSDEFEGATKRLADACTNGAPSIEKAQGGLQKYGEMAQRSAKSVDEMIRAQSELADTISERNAKAQTDINTLQRARDVMDEYMNKTDLTVREQGMLRDAVDTVNDMCGTQYQVMDAVNGVVVDQEGAVQDTTEAIDDYIAKMQEKIRVDALEENLKGLYQQKTEAIASMATAYENMQNAYEESAKLADLEAQGCSVGTEKWLEQATAVEKAEEEYDKAKTAVGKVKDNIAATESMIGATTEAVNGNVDSLRALVESSDVVQASFSGMPSELDEFASALEGTGMTMDEFSALGQDKVIQLAAEFSRSNGNIVEAMRNTGLKLPAIASNATSSVANRFNASAGTAGAAGRKAMFAYSNAIKQGKSPREAKAIAESVGKNLKVDGGSIGANAAAGMASGLRDGKFKVELQARALAKAAKDAANKELDVNSPSRVFRQIGSYVGQGLALGMEGETARVKRASERLSASSIFSPAQSAFPHALAAAGGDTYHITINAGPSQDANDLALAFANAVQSRNALRGRKTTAFNVRSI